MNADILRLRYPRESIDEVRLHHVFEHFPRQVACALLAAWQTWLKRGGILRIEVPDLVRTGLASMNPFISLRRRCVAERHLFGSHEAPWAVHREGYSTNSLRRLMSTFGFAEGKVERNSWRGTHNLEITASKIRDLSRLECDLAARAYLVQYLLDESESELKLLDTWMEEYSAHAGVLVP